MAGILYNKTRIMDIVMTQEGKRQLASGDFQVKYASFTDRGTYYDKSSISGSTDTANERLYFEATSLPYDSITVEANDQGNVLGVGITGNTEENSAQKFIVFDGTIADPAGAPILNGAAKFASYVDDILASTTQNFRKQRILASRDPVDDSDTFEVTPQEARLVYGNRGPIVGEELTPSVNQAPSLLTHRRFSNSLNFAYLPPIVKDNDSFRPLGSFPNIKEADSYTYDDIMRELNGKDLKNPICPRQEVRFTETSQTNDICIQAFEVNGNKLKKLDMVDFGDVQTPEGNNLRIFFLGKVFVDSYQSATFANIFTLILE
jgi:hypothetical protein